MSAAKIFPAVLIVITLAGPICHSQTKSPKASMVKMSLLTGWQFREVGKDNWYPATVPGCVHTDLLSNKLIDDPFYRDNEQRLQWIGKTDWEYQTTFKVGPDLLSRDQLELVFDGLDTYADVFLNDAPLLSADNMFRTWRIECKRLLKPGNNVLRIRFRSPINEVLPSMAKMSYQLPASNDQGEKTSPYTRKAPYQYGWDWGPRFVTSGIWRPIHLEAWDQMRINDLNILPNQVTRDAANLTANVEIITVDFGSARIILENLRDHHVVASRDLNLTQGRNSVKLDFVIPNPALWWPNGLGAQPLYPFK